MADAVIKITADVASAERDLKRFQKQVDDLDSSLHSGLNKALGGVAVAAAAMGVAIMHALNSAGELIDAANNLGIAAQSLQAMQHAAALTGVSADALNSSLQKLNSNIGSALINGTGGATDALKKLNLPLKDIAAMKTDKQFEVIAAEINKIPNAAERSALAVELFGKQGPKMLAMAENIGKARHEMEAMGLALSDIDLAALDMAGDSVDELKMIFESGLKKAVAEIAPYIVAMVTAIKRAIEEAGGFEVIWGKIKSATKTVIDLMVIIAAMKIAVGAIALYNAMKAAGTAAAVFNAVVKKNPLMLAVGAALVLAKVLGLDVAGALFDAAGLSDDVAKANEDIAASAKEIAARNQENNQVLDQINKKQQDYLDTLDSIVAKSASDVQYEREKLLVGEQLATINKTIREEKEKAQKAGVFDSEAATKEYNSKIAGLKITLQENEELKNRNSIIKGLADAYETSFSKAWKKAKEVDKAIIAMEDARASGKSINPDAEKQLADANKQVTQEYTSALLDITDKGAAERYAIKVKYAKQEQALEETRLLFASQGYNTDHFITASKAQQELDLYNLKVKLASDEVTMNANKYAKMMSDSDAYYLKTIGGEKAVQDAAKARAEFDAKTMYEKTQIGIEQGAQLFSALGAQNKKAFEAAKALNIASAIMNTYASVTKALAAYPFPFSLIPAGAALAMGMAQVSQIRAQSYSGRALGGPVMGGNPYIVGENGPELFTPNTTGSITRNGDLGGGVTNVNFTILANDAQGFDDLLAQRRGMITQMVNDAMVEKGQRM